MKRVAEYLIWIGLSALAGTAFSIFVLSGIWFAVERADSLAVHDPHFFPFWGAWTWFFSVALGATLGFSVFLFPYQNAEQAEKTRKTTQRVFKYAQKWALWGLALMAIATVALFASDLWRKALPTVLKEALAGLFLFCYLTVLFVLVADLPASLGQSVWTWWRQEKWREDVPWWMIVVFVWWLSLTFGFILLSGLHLPLSSNGRVWFFAGLLWGLATLIVWRLAQRERWKK